MRKRMILGIFLFVGIIVGTACGQKSELITAIHDDDKATVGALIAKGADVNAEYESPFSPSGVDAPLELAVASGEKDIAELLIAKGADVNPKDTYDVPLILAAYNGDVGIAELLIAKGASVNATNKSHDTPLEMAISHGKTNMAELLIAKGADVNAETSGRTPLNWAISGRHKEIVELLIAKGAKVNSEAFFQADDISDPKERHEIKDVLQSVEVRNIENQPGGVDGAFQRAQERFKGHSDDDSLREAVIHLALLLHPTPAIPAEAEADAGRGTYIFKNAASPDEVLSAAKEYLSAIEAAPWVADYYFNLCTVLEKTPYTAQALHACKLYLVAAPEATDAAAVRQRIAGLQYAADRDHAQTTQRSAYARAIGVNEMYRFGGISGTVSGKDLVLKLFVDWTAAPPKYQVYAGCIVGGDVYGDTHDLVSTDTWMNFCKPTVSMHLIIKPEGEGFVEVSDSNGGNLRATLDGLFNAKQKAMSQAALFYTNDYQSDGSQGGRFYVPYVQGGVDDKYAGFAMYESDCKGSLLKQDPHSLPDDFIPLEVIKKTGGYGRYLGEGISSGACLFNFATKTGYHFGETE